MLGDAMELISDEEDEMEEVAWERDFHFNVEIAKLIDQSIVNNILNLVKVCDTIDMGIVSAIAHLFNRMMKQCNGTFIFYQLYALDVFETFLMQHWKDVFFNELTVVVKTILEKFSEALAKNSLLPLEIIFQF